VKGSITSHPCGFNPFSLYAITEVSRKPKQVLLTRDFKTYTFQARFSPIRARDNYIKLLADLTNVDEVIKDENKGVYSIQLSTR